MDFGDNDDPSGQPSHKVKIALLGNEGVGKTSILSQLTEQKYNARTNTTVGAMFINKGVQVDQEKFEMQLWDTAGQERFRTIASIYFRDAHGIVLVYDVTNRKSYDDMNYWFNEIYAKCEKSVIVTIIGNKCDLADNVITVEEANKFAQTHKCRHLLVSAKTGQNIQDTFEILIRDIAKSEILNTLHARHAKSVAVKKKTPGQSSKEKDCKC